MAEQKTLTNQYPSLRGRTVFITGGGSGIGAALVEAFVAQGSQVAFVDILEDESKALVEKVNENSSSGKAHFYPCNLVDIEHLRQVVEQVKSELGAIGVLINNAASDTRHDFRDVTPEYWDERMHINLRPQFFAAQAVYSQMKELGGGSIINFGSMSWHESQGNMPGYTSAKSAVLGLTRGLARDMGEDNIRVNTLTPGWVMTERQLSLWVTEETKKDIAKNQCINAPLMPESIAAMALFLASDDSSMCTAQDFIVDAGWV
ncbi:NAD(P)-dependent dehydrogenase (short-subunit alcohol dehydrogenase family) [Idiomarina loihiensis]|uniref:SDR family NAD(P)-dependent oxidoreductase n=1 Tax=Idiomarina TaxID=135575 RepID=UPI000D718402|nr:MULTISPECIES: SDR family oxidoreductase [Idiomarina]PWW34513.1 NAD(P)-dependent dehydrogenase (short-subunit alcohol dehydrogenase family) [Idiomarina loihiensis]TDP47643.1 NAD(P)-dependent dehydrogenase (short-subunit alcohol dehydrogenase family) [Idiomarina loihiensis]TDS23384.1 NAD(P)-dependent dehydrogenase (short-subunit alcohol dehydrogenase family) [Idiomarina sp. H2]